METILMFSGQGSQYYEMGKSLFSLDTNFRDIMLEFNSIYMDYEGKSLLSEIYDGRGMIFDDILFTHPAIYMTEVALARTVMNYGIKVIGVLGMSMGEFAALTIASVVRFEDILPIVIKQAKCIKEYCYESEMITVLEDYSIFYEEPVFYNHAYMASINYKNNFVISCTQKSGMLIKDYLKEKKIPFMELPVKYGFHSPLIDAAKEKFLGNNSPIQFRNSVYKYYSCLAEMSENKSVSYFWDVARKPMNVIKVFEQIKSKKALMIDLGISGTMANFAKYNLNTSNVRALLTQFSCRNEYEYFQGIMKRLPLMSDIQQEVNF